LQKSFWGDDHNILHRMWVSETDLHVGFGAKVTLRLRLKLAR
jgi:transposase